MKSRCLWRTYTFVLEINTIYFGLSVETIIQWKGIRQGMRENGGKQRNRGETSINQDPCTFLEVLEAWQRDLGAWTIASGLDKVP